MARKLFKGKNIGKVDEKAISFIKSIGGKMVIVFVLLTLLGNLGMTYISIKNSKRLLTDEVSSNMKILAEEGAEVARAQLESSASGIDMISRLPKVESMKWEEQKGVFLSSVDREEFKEIVVMDLYGGIKKLYMVVVFSRRD